VTRKRECMVCVVAMVNIGDLQIGFVNGGFERHGA
jgi:hypothetical protein